MPARNLRNRAGVVIRAALQQSGFRSWPGGMFEFEAPQKVTR